jgi:hypothetical protein
LAKNEAVHQKDDLIKWQYQKQVQDRIEEALTSPSFYSQEVKDGIFYKQNGKSRAGKHDQNHHYLKKAFKLPFGLKVSEEARFFGFHEGSLGSWWVFTR